LDAAKQKRIRWILMIAAALAFRIAVVASWHAPAGDGIQYYKLSQELWRHGRFAFGPEPQEPIWSRLPGYPLFLALVVHGAPVGLDTHLRRATVANALLDVGTALLMASLLARRRSGRGAPELTFALVIFCPLVLFLSCYGLTESLATFLGALEVWLAARAAERGSLALIAAAGLTGGVAQMVRVDMLGFVPVVLVLWLGATAIPRRRIAAGAGLFALAFALGFAPWPLRNQLRFGEPHPMGTEWIAQDGSPLPTGMLRWMRSWSGNRPGEAYPLMMVANRRPLDPNKRGELLDVMFDDEAERAEVTALYRRYDAERLSPDVDAGFAQLARERARKHPLRQYVGLPFLRMITLWSPVPSYELPMRSALLWLPRLRVLYDIVLMLLLAASVAGVALLFRRDRTLATALVVGVVVRTFAIAYEHPFPTQRYQAELLPLLMVAAAVALSAGVERLRKLRRA
jgi:hypothetical protein